MKQTVQKIQSMATLVHLTKKINIIKDDPDDNAYWWTVRDQFGNILAKKVTESRDLVSAKDIFRLDREKIDAHLLRTTGHRAKRCTHHVRAGRWHKAKAAIGIDARVVLNTLRNTTNRFSIVDFVHWRYTPVVFRNVSKYQYSFETNVLNDL